MATAEGARPSLRVSKALLRAVSVAALLLITVLVQLRSLFSLGVPPIIQFPKVSDNDAFEHMFATKTKYWDQRDGELEENEGSVMRALVALPALAETVGREPLRQELELVQTQIVARHGIRYPTGGNIREIQELLKKVQVFQDKLPQWMRNYSLPYNLSMAGELAVAGKRELFDFGRRCLSSSGQSKPVVYRQGAYRVAHTHVARTRDSAIAFAKAFFSNVEEVKYIEYPKSKDVLLRFFDECSRYQREVKLNKTAQSQMYEFQGSDAMIQNAQWLKESLGLVSESIAFTAKDLMAVQSACAFDVALYSGNHTWCSLMSTAFVRSLEYLDDLEEFYWIGAGYKINYEMAAVLLREIFKTMQDRVDGTSELTGNYFFAHAETTLPLMTLLGYGDRSKLLANATEGMIASRGFRTSELSPFAANIVFRLFEHKSRRGEFYVQLLVNEKRRKIPGCGRVFCKLTELEELWHYYLKTYDFHEDCQ